MEILKFKTNIYSAANQSALTVLLNAEPGIVHWNLKPDDYTLTVSGEQLDPERVKKLVEKAGFQAEFIQVFGIGGSSL